MFFLLIPPQWHLSYTKSTVCNAKYTFTIWDYRGGSVRLWNHPRETLHFSRTIDSLIEYWEPDYFFPGFCKMCGYLFLTMTTNALFNHNRTTWNTDLKFQIRAPHFTGTWPLCEACDILLHIMLKDRSNQLSYFKSIRKIRKQLCIKQTGNTRNNTLETKFHH